MEQSQQSSAQARKGPNALEQRIRDVTYMLSEHSHKFVTGAMPNHNQVTEALKHCQVCFDQLQHITRDYSNTPIEYLQPKVFALSTHNIVKTTKHLMRNLKTWLETYSVDLENEANQAKMRQKLTFNGAKCSMCKNSLEAMTLKEAKVSILGPEYARQLFDQCFQAGKAAEDTKEEAEKKEEQKKEYNGSVNYLTKVIKDMETSVQGYDNMVNSLNNAHDPDRSDLAMSLLSDVIGKMTEQFGSKIKQRASCLIRRVPQSPLPSHSKYLDIYSPVFSMVIAPDKRKTNFDDITDKDELIDKLRQENRELNFEQYSLKSMLSKAEDSVARLEVMNRQLNREIQRANMKRDDSAEARNSQKRSRTLMGQKRRSSSQLGKIPDASSLDPGQGSKPHATKKSSIFSLKRQSRISMIHGGEQPRLQNRESGLLEVGEDILSEDGDFEQRLEEEKMIDVGIQWEQQEDQLREQRLKNKKKKKNKLNPARSSSKIFNKTNYKPDRTVSKIIDKTMKDSRLRQTMNEGHNIRQSAILRQTKKGTKNSEMPSIMRKATREFLKTEGNEVDKFDMTLNEDSKIQLRKSQSPGDRLADFGEGTLSTSKFYKKKQQTKGAEPVKDITQNEDKKKEEQRRKELGNQESYPFELTSQLDKITGKKGQSLNKRSQIATTLPTLNPPPQQTPSQHRPFKMLNNRMKTEGSQVNKKRTHKGKNIFRPEHLELFGGVSQSYNYQKNPADDGQECLGPQELGYITGMESYIVNLSKFKNVLFDNVVSFLKSPYDTIQSDEAQTAKVSTGQVRALIVRLVQLHVKKCGHANCEHMKRFGAIIGFNYLS